MTRFYDELVASLFDVVSPQLTLLILLALTGLVAALWYWYPAWVPRRMPRLRFTFPRLRLPRWRFPRVRLRWHLTRWRRKPKAKRRPKAEPVLVTAEPEAAPEPLGAPGLSLADRLAAEGRYAEAIRERLRETVSDLTRAGVITPEPGTTALELTADAAARRPVVGAPLGGATAIFSEIWYGRRAASPGHDDRMRTLTAEVRSSITVPRGGTE
ncbi:DUF4129 domain-containing protein [Actinoplanes sp. NPDC020271]|uniref:DUF4129 domain-containing protein n=1 Tax=Actinoplanes sp. NPDC020271 TaxID=3363896 RepID=UPI00379533A6